MLIRINLDLPMLPTYEFYSDPKYMNCTASEVEKNILDLYTRLDNSVDRIAMGEHYPRIIELLKTAKPQFSLRVAWHWISKLQIIDNISRTDVEDLRDKVYSIILGTEHLITEKLNVDTPVIYGFHVEEITKTSAKTYYGILSRLNLECKALVNSRLALKLKSFYIIPNIEFC